MTYTTSRSTNVLLKFEAGSKLADCVLSSLHLSFFFPFFSLFLCIIIAFLSISEDNVTLTEGTSKNITISSTAGVADFDLVFCESVNVFGS